ncbi:MAG TPA: PepSY domain-containing protein [Methylophilus sp.]|nr:PepSY domain-containing protein [Methylophilus sp.]HQQ32924.1 PepSY domain-containing protein [Methylophilus sp.]
MKSTLFKTVAISTIFMSLFSFKVVADDDDEHEIEMYTKEFGLITLEDARKKALAAKPGVVKDADLENRKFSKGWDYEFEIVDSDGKEWEVNIDAKTGQVESIHRDWF